MLLKFHKIMDTVYPTKKVYPLNIETSVSRAIVLYLLINIIISGTPAQAEDLFTKLSALRWIAYAPTRCNPEKQISPSILSVEEDLKTLRQAGFEGIITYTCHEIYAAIPAIARPLGFKGIIIGVWDLDDVNEWNNAVALKNYADGYCIGNEGLKSRYDFDRLAAKIEQLRTETGKPVTTSEEYGDYVDRRLMLLGDWIFPNVHPIFAGITDPLQAAEWIKEQYGNLGKMNKTNKRILFKEVGFPTAGADYASENNQALFFTTLEKRHIAMAYFEAYDQPWKDHLPVEPHWGLFDVNHEPKKYIRERMKSLEESAAPARKQRE